MLCTLAALQKKKAHVHQPHHGSSESMKLHHSRPSWFSGSVWPRTWAHRCWFLAFQSSSANLPDLGCLAELGLRSPPLSSQSVLLSSAGQQLIHMLQRAQQLQPHNFLLLAYACLNDGETNLERETLAHRGVSFQMVQSTKGCMRMERPEALSERL